MKYTKTLFEAGLSWSKETKMVTGQYYVNSKSQMNTEEDKHTVQTNNRPELSDNYQLRNVFSTKECQSFKSINNGFF